MTEMKDKIYPSLPDVRESLSAPAIELNEMGNDQGHIYRLKVISNVQKFLETEISNREAFSKKYFRIARIVSNIDRYNNLCRRCRCRIVSYWYRFTYSFRVRN